MSTSGKMEGIVFNAITALGILGTVGLIWFSVCLVMVVKEEKEQWNEYTKTHECKITATETVPQQANTTLVYNDTLKVFLPVQDVKPAYDINTWTCNDGNVYVR